MKLRSLRVSDQPQLMIVPMIDIIFFLLVFFMMSTLYMTAQQTIPINLPQAASSRQDKQPSTAVTVRPDGNVMVEQEIVSLTVLPQKISTVLAEKPDSIFVLRADKTTDYEKVVSVLDGLKTAGAHRIAIATEKKEK
jgi:biopolymer transport protein ExbD